MAAVGFCGDWLVLTCDTRLIAVHSHSRESFLFDCSTAEKKPRDANRDDGVSSEETGSDRVLAFTASASGKLLALTDDSKRLLLFQCERSWRVVSTRWVVRRGTSLMFSRAEDQLLLADKSGDVYSFSVDEPEKEGELKLGHLSMVLAVTTSENDRFIITADRDEKIRVSHFASPYNIQSFCLGHEQFVSALLVPSGHPHWLLSGSGDGTIKLWDHQTGRQLQSWDLSALEETSTESQTEKKWTVNRISSSSDGRHVAVQCDRISVIRFFSVEQEGEQKLVPHSRLPLSSVPLDMTFDLQGRLWVLMDSSDSMLQIFRHTQSSWECEAASPELNRVTEALTPQWNTLEASSRSTSRFEHLHKSSFDNVSVYLQKKEQRLQQQKRKKCLRADDKKKVKMEMMAGTES